MDKEYALRQAEDAEDRAAPAARCLCGACGRAVKQLTDADPALLHAAERLRICGCACT